MRKKNVCDWGCFPLTPCRSPPVSPMHPLVLSLGLCACLLGCGCVCSYGGTPLFQGTSSLNQVDLIMQCLGKPTAGDVASLHAPYAESTVARMHVRKGTGLQGRFPTAPREAVDLMQQLFVFDPSKRPSTAQVLAREFARSPTLSDNRYPLAWVPCHSRLAPPSVDTQSPPRGTFALDSTLSWPLLSLPS